MSLGDEFYDLPGLDTCTVCGAPVTGQHGVTLRIAGSLTINMAHLAHFTGLDTCRAASCGQHHTLVLVERYLERGTFAPADHTANSTEEVSTNG